MKKKIFVTEPYMPDLDQLIPYLKKIWNSKIISNAGPYHQELERKLAEYLGVPFVSLTNNGDNALHVAIKSMDMRGEVITTPYSFISTSNSILWNDLKPVFVDVLPDTGNINPDLIERKITNKTSAILAVHCYGYPCEVRKIENLAQKYKLKVIYDAAHCFGVKENNGHSILNYGDLSILSFHATKVFNTFEGGAIISHTKEQKNKIDKIKNFGISDEDNIDYLGTNAKMSEFNAAYGVLLLETINTAIDLRKKNNNYYIKKLGQIKGIKILNKGGAAAIHNYSYFPIIVEDNYSLSRDELYDHLKDNNVFSRKYFYPLITNTKMYKKFECVDKFDLPVANWFSDNILCLPIHPNLSFDEIDRVVSIMKEK